MLCSDPYVKGSEAFPCGKCLPCIKRRKALWTHRIMMEAACHSENAFVTLTYADEYLPVDMSLEPATLQKFLKRLRKAVSPRSIRYYGVGEYGDVTERPHYHLILFGYQSCLRGQSMYSKLRTSCCSQCDTIREIWGLGHVYLGSVNTQSVGYVCSYIVKNMRRTDDYRLKGRWPEFARMSLKPGIGYEGLWEVADTIMKYQMEETQEDVPTGLRHGKNIKPLGRYLRAKLRTMVGKDEKPEWKNIDPEMLSLLNRAKDATPKGGEVRKTYFKNLLIDASHQKVLNMEAKYRIHKQRKSL